MLAKIFVKICHRSSGVEHTHGKGGVEGSIPSGGSSFSIFLFFVLFLP
jgi:hypothetical protein